ncbi:GNAT family N-acetyltransferase [Streptomyces sp. NPDC047841]|uniref:GNAT family N-acetyltransferase n=1 Tax=Streptomyces sp. NPDC047841 TaxID=3154708 RepID=UPI003452CB03
MAVKRVDDLEPQLANCRDYWLGWGEADRADDGLTYYRSGLAHGQLNGVLRLRSPGEAGQALARATSALAGVPWLWWVGPDSGPGVADRLLKQGARRIGAVPIMAVALDRVAQVAGPPELRIETVEGAGALAEWVRTYSPSFGVGPDLVDDTLRVEAGRGDVSRTVRFIARIGQQAVGTALMFDSHDVAGIYVVTTVEGHRRRGIGAKLTAAALEAGRQRGLHVGTLQASAPGQSVYARMGFETVGAYQLFQPLER